MGDIEKRTVAIESQKQITISRTSKVSPGVDSEGLQRYGYEKTVAFPATSASVRGSDAFNDLTELSEAQLRGIESTVLSEFPEETQEHHGKHTSVDLTFDPVPLKVKIEEWLQEREQQIPYPKSLSTRKHFIRIINTLNYDEKILEVGNYMTVNDVLKFYSDYNTNCREYTWKDIWGSTLQMGKSLGENGLTDNSAIIDEIGLDHFPTILLYFKDGFENDPPLKLDISQSEPTGLNAPCRNY